VTGPIASREHLGAFCRLRQAAYEEWRFTGGLHRSSDPVIAGNHFTNIFRELDPGTVLARRLLARHMPADTRSALWTAVAYRLTNRREIWEAFHHETEVWPTPANEDEWLQFCESARSRGDRVFTGRHLTVGWPRYNRALQDVRHLEDGWVADAFKSARDFSHKILEVHGVGPFFAWQVTADLMMSGHLEPDPHHVVLGPGAKFALRWIVDGRSFGDVFNAAGRRVVAAGTGHMRDVPAYNAIMDLWSDQRTWLHPWVETSRGRLRPALTLVDLEHALCEYGRWGVLHARRQRGR
jgi:hypothetical protein